MLLPKSPTALQLTPERQRMTQCRTETVWNVEMWSENITASGKCYTFLLKSPAIGEEKLWSAQAGHDGITAVERLAKALTDQKERAGNRFVKVQSHPDARKNWEHFDFRAATPPKPVQVPVDLVSDLFN